MYSQIDASQGAKHLNRIDAVTAALVGQSVLTLLETRVLCEIASYPEDWRTARATVRAIAEKCGREYHPQSVRRVNRKLDRLRFIEKDRLFTGDALPAAAKKPTGSQCGTTVKRVRWEALGLSYRKVRAVRKAQRRSQAELLRRAEQSTKAKAKALATPTGDDRPMPRTGGALAWRPEDVYTRVVMSGAALVPDG